MIRWADSKPRMRREGGLFFRGDVVPDGYFTAEEVANLVSRDKITVLESRQVEIGASEPDEPAKALEPDEPAKALEPDEPAKALEPDEPAKALEPDEPEPIDIGDSTSGKAKAKAKRWRKS